MGLGLGILRGTGTMRTPFGHHEPTVVGRDLLFNSSGYKFVNASRIVHSLINFFYSLSGSSETIQAESRDQFH